MDFIISKKNFADQAFWAVTIVYFLFLGKTTVSNLLKKFQRAANSSCYLKTPKRGPPRIIFDHSALHISGSSVEQGWCIGKNTRLLPTWPRFDSQNCQFVSSLPCTEKFFFRVRWFCILLKKPTYDLIQVDLRFLYKSPVNVTVNPKINRGYYMAVGRYEILLKCWKIFHEWAQWTHEMFFSSQREI